MTIADGVIYVADEDGKARSAYFLRLSTPGNADLGKRPTNLLRCSDRFSRYRRGEQRVDAIQMPPEGNCSGRRR